MCKRKRDATFTIREKEVVLDLVQKNFSIIESKKTDSSSIRNKNDQWVKITTEFNSISTTHHREWTTLKNCWENMKKRAKQTQRNQHFVGTGGGPPIKDNVDPINNKVLDLIQNRITEFVNIYDSDDNSTDTEKPHTEILDAQPTIDIMTDPTSTSHSDENEKILLIPKTETDWSPLNMLQENTNPLSETLPEGQENPETLSQKNQTSTTPKRIRTGTSCRRSLHKDNEEQHIHKEYMKERLNTLLKSQLNADEEHKVKLRILKLQEQQEMFKTKQEEIKFKLLEMELRNLKRTT